MSIEAAPAPTARPDTPALTAYDVRDARRIAAEPVAALALHAQFETGELDAGPITRAKYAEAARLLALPELHVATRAEHDGRVCDWCGMAGCYAETRVFWERHTHAADVRTSDWNVGAACAAAVVAYGERDYWSVSAVRCDDIDGDEVAEVAA